MYPHHELLLRPHTIMEPVWLLVVQVPCIDIPLFHAHSYTFHCDFKWVSFRSIPFRYLLLTVQRFIVCAIFIPIMQISLRLCICVSIPYVLKMLAQWLACHGSLQSMPCIKDISPKIGRGSRVSGVRRIQQMTLCGSSNGIVAENCDPFLHERANMQGGASSGRVQPSGCAAPRRPGKCGMPRSTEKSADIKGRFKN